MKTFTRNTISAAVLSCFAGVATAADELVVHVFRDAAPAKGLSVSLDGGAPQPAANDVFVFDAGAGRHVLKVVGDSGPLAEYSFELERDRLADITINLKSSGEPEFFVDAYNPSNPASGGPGLLQGYVTDASNAPVADATVRLEPIGIETKTDAAGGYRLQAPRGNYAVVVEHEGYQTSRSSGLRIVAGLSVNANIALRTPATASAPAAADGVAEVVITGTSAPKPTDIQRFSSAVTNAISVEQLSQAGDSDVGASLKRVVGVSVQGGRYAVVRGLASRYISTTLNGDLMASTNPYRRDVELDMFPAEILSGIEIQKTFTADMPGDTTGGAIKIGTRGLPDGFVASLSAKLGGTTGTTGKKLYTYEGGDGDWLGMDDDTRALPGVIDRITNGGRNTPSAEESAAYAAALPNIYTPKRETASPDYGLSLALGNSFAHDIGLIGVYGMASYDRGFESRQDGTRADLRNVTETTFQRDIVSTELNGYLVAGIEADGWNLYSKTMVLRQTEDTTEFEDGDDIDDGTPFDQTLLEFNERQFLAEQLQGDVKLFGTHKLALRAGISQTSSETPDRRSYRYQNDRFVSTSLQRLYADLKEDALDFGADYSLPLDFSDKVNTTVKFGALYDKRDRSNDLVRIALMPTTVDTTDSVEELLTPENFANGTFRLRGASTATDSYEADQETLAGYLSTETNFGEAFTVIAGVRQDNFETKLRFPNSSRTPETSLKSDELLPSLGLIYRLGDDWQFRGGYSRTVSRPSITELSPSVFFDDRGRRFIGCTRETVRGLEPCSASTIDNFDLRAEYYINNADSISLAVFHKEIDKPLERGLLDGGTSGYTYRNSDSAKVTGVELDGQTSWLLAGAHNLVAGANISWIDSEITLDADGQRIEGRRTRELQGQSPLLANARLSYEHYATQQTATLTASYYDDRIDVAGGNGLQSIFEQGRVVLNLTYAKEFANGSTLGLKLRNLLDDDYKYTQRDAAGTDRTIERWKTGINGEISYTYKFH